MAINNRSKSSPINIPSAENRSTDEWPAENQPQYNISTNTKSNNKKSKREVDILPNKDYEDLVSVYGKGEVDDQIRKIIDRHYTGCMNKETIGAWCLERQGRKNKLRRNPFQNFEQRKYSAEFYNDLEQKMMGVK